MKVLPDKNTNRKCWYYYNKRLQISQSRERKNVVNQFKSHLSKYFWMTLYLEWFWLSADTVFSYFFFFREKDEYRLEDKNALTASTWKMCKNIGFQKSSLRRRRHKVSLDFGKFGLSCPQKRSFKKTIFPVDTANILATFIPQHCLLF